jgi:anti-anti-sigma factor
VLSACDIAARVVLDMREVAFMDSMGLRSVMDAKDLCAERGVELAVIPNPEVLKIFEVTGLVDEVPWHPREP